MNAERGPWRPFPVADRAFTGAVLGLGGGLGLLAIGAIRWLVAGAPGDPFTVQDLLPAVLYVVAAAGSGAVGGALLPLAATKRGAIGVGVVAIQPLVLTIMTQFGEPDAPAVNAGLDVGGWLVLSLIFGPVVGLTWVHGWSRSDNAA